VGIAVVSVEVSVCVVVVDAVDVKEVEDNSAANVVVVMFNVCSSLDFSLLT